MQETQKLINSRSKEPVLFQCSHKDYFKKDTKLSEIYRILEMLDKPGKQQEILFFYLKFLLTTELYHKYEKCTLFFICRIRCRVRVNVVRVLYTTVVGENRTVRL